MPTYRKTFLTEDQKEKYGRRLSHYLEDYCHRFKVTHAKAAEQLGLSTNKFTQLKSGGEQGRFLSSLDYLQSIASLTGMPVEEFVTYLRGTSAPKPTGKRYNWQDKIYKGLEHASISIRRRFADICLQLGTQDSDKLEQLLRIVNALSEKDAEALESLADAVEKM